MQIGERDRTSDNQANSVATVYWRNNDGFGIAWLRDPETDEISQMEIYR